MTAKPGPWIRWLGYFAWVLLALLTIAVLTVRSGNWQQGLILYAIACLLSLVVLALLALMSLLPRCAGQRGAIVRRALPAIPGTALLLMALVGQDVPPIHDITTDTEDPPRFERVPELRSADSNSLAVDPEVIEQQTAAYPDLDTITSDRSYGDTYAAARSTAAAMGWEIVRDDVNAGVIEAVATTAIMAFKDDVVIRVRTSDSATLVDLRSASRVGISDLGANAKRIREFAARLQEALQG